MTSATTTQVPKPGSSRKFRVRFLAYGVCAFLVIAFIAALLLPHYSELEQRSVDFLSIASCIEPSRDLVTQRILSGEMNPAPDMKALLRSDEYCPALVKGGKILSSGAIEIDARIAARDQMVASDRTFNSYVRIDAKFVFFPTRTNDNTITWSQSCAPKDLFTKILCNHE